MPHFFRDSLAPPACFHCGLPCKNLIQKEDHPFCCLGCLSVFEILKQNHLHQYYDLDKTPGQAPEKEKNLQNPYQYLDEPKFLDKILDFQDSKVGKVTFEIPAIHCISCVWLLENLYRLNPEIYVSRVLFLQKRVQITYHSGNIPLSQIVTLLSKLGYPPRLNLDAFQKQEELFSKKNDLIPLGVAGFCFGNVMLFSFPEYLAGSEVPLAFQSFFQMLSFFLSIPALFYSGFGWFRGAVVSLRNGFLSMDVPIVLGLMALFFQSSFEVFSGTGSGYFDSLCGFIFFLLIGRWFQEKTFFHLSFDRDYTSYFPLAAIVEKKDKEESVLIEKLNPDDIILVRGGEVIPTDSLLLSHSAKIDYSFITGEGEAILKNKGDSVPCGGKVVGSRAKMKVLKKTSGSFLIGLWQDYQKENIPSNASNPDFFVSYFTLTMIGIAFISSFYWIFFARNFPKGVYVFSSVLIVACPCALALTKPFIYGSFLRILAKSGIFLKNGTSLDQLSFLDTLVFDKTGTLTELGIDLELLEGHLSDLEEQMVLTIAKNSVHPVSQALVTKFSKKNTLPFNNFKELSGKGIQGFIEGKQVYIGKKEWIQKKISHFSPCNNFKKDSHQLAILIDQKIKAIYTIHNKYRENWGQKIQEVEKTYFIHLISGDTDRERPILESFFSNPKALHFNLNPLEKIEYIQKLQKKNCKVAMIGDGLNDAGALLKSDFGIAMVEKSSHFSPSCDCIMNGQSFSLLPSFFKLGKVSKKLIYISFSLSLLYNTIGLSYAVTGHLSPLIAAILMPASSGSVILLTTLGARYFSSRLGFKSCKEPRKR